MRQRKRNRLTKEQVKMFRAGLKSFRDKLIFDVLYESGLRLAELVALRLQDYSDYELSQKVGEIYVEDRDDEDQNRDKRHKTGSRLIPIPLIRKL